MLFYWFIQLSVNKRCSFIDLFTQGELIGWDSSRRPCPSVRLFVRLLTLSNKSISETSRSNQSQISSWASLERGNCGFGFGPDRIRTLVSMGGMLWPLYIAPSFLIGSASSLQVTRTTIKSWMSLKFSKIWPGTAELAALKRLEKSPKTYNGRYALTTLYTLHFTLFTTLL